MKNIPGSKPLPFGLPFLLAVHFLVGVSAAVGAQTSANQVRTYSGFIDEKTESITVVTDQFYPPYSFIGESGSLEGISIDLWKEWEKVTGIHVDLRGMNWASAIQHVTEGKADVIDTFFVTDERKKTFLFTDTYAEIDVPVFLHRSISGIKSLSDLTGFTIAVKTGDSSIQVLEEAGIENLLEFRNYSDIIRAAKIHDIRAFCMDKPSADFLMAKAGVRDFVPVASLYVGQISRGVLKTRQSIFEKVKKGFSQIPQSRIREINRSWYGTAVPYAFNYRPIVFIALILLVVFTVLVAFILFLRFQVDLKTGELKTQLDLLERSERWNKAFIRALPDLFFVIDRWGYYLDYSVNDERLLRSTSEGLIGKNISDVFSPELVSVFMEAVHDVLRHGGIREIEYELEVPAGLRHFECRIVSMDTDTALYIARDITGRKEIEQRVVQSLNEKEVLLKEKEVLFREVHHRVKNNLQIVSSLLTMQSDLFESEKGLTLIREIQNRIQSIAHLHELLYQSKDIASISLQEYFSSIIREISITNHEQFSRIDLCMDTGLIRASLEAALPLGLTVNELVSNSVKYAFPEGTGGTIRISSRVDESSVCFDIADSGVGLPPDFDPDTSESLGFVLVRSFASQLGGTVQYLPGGGACFEVRVPSGRLILDAEA